MKTFKGIFFMKWILLIQIKLCINWKDDYWSDDFDPNQNCKYPDLVRNLSIMEPSQCTKVALSATGAEEAFWKCKTRLSRILHKSCDFTKMDEPGDLLYCRMRGLITCCFVNQICALGWLALDEQIYKNAKTYLKDKKGYLSSLVNSAGYKTCHALNSLDASKCAEDCKNLEKEKFATNCTSNGGLFKCCVRRDKRGCDECRFCCTLPMCTYPPGGEDNTVFEGLNNLKLENQQNKMRADDVFFSDEVIHKSDDYRCLEPYSHTDPKKWHTYEMNAYRKAFTSKTLKSVRSFKHDNYHFNFDDPEVFKSFTNSEKDARKYFKRSYGIEYIKIIPGYGEDKQTVNVAACKKECIKLENSRFAQKCRKKGGYFKCCITDYSLNAFEKTRLRLFKEGLLKNEQDPVCKPFSMKDPCHFCSLDGICTWKNKLTWKIKHAFYPNKKLIKKRHKVGGKICWV